jgi:hypothetical protein
MYVSGSFWYPKPPLGLEDFGIGCHFYSQKLAAPLQFSMYGFTRRCRGPPISGSKDGSQCRSLLAEALGTKMRVEPVTNFTGIKTQNDISGIYHFQKALARLFNFVRGASEYRRKKTIL